jgi:hypothetical protein
MNHNEEPRKKTPLDDPDWHRYSPEVQKILLKTPPDKLYWGPTDSDYQEEPAWFWFTWWGILLKWTLRLLLATVLLAGAAFTLVASSDGWKILLWISFGLYCIHRFRRASRGEG